ncbi:tail fiber/spike domain-containing protein [Serratia fonticola]|uniref:tail fiber/spike domain-containing protein n=1 Tax=Serratia fonticola TaxID=47917 RepID=UPI00217761CC|nr:hypothetical protein [Serratia fonticola]CAI1595277.1 Uncharacterised protein [Serratia fonticola]CAI1903823.1 Uncharacterised protein [Serratia fonticola]CAI1928237.1 Uncharacterised protein [Serratia fonticola]
MSSEGLPLNNVVEISTDLTPRNVQEAANSASISQNADSAAISADAAWKFSRTAATAAEIAAMSKEEAAAYAAQSASASETAYEDSREAIDQAIRESGFSPIDSFEDGANLTLVSQALRWKGNNNAFYSWRGPFPKFILPGSTPETTGGFGDNAWVDVSDLTLRTSLAAPGGAHMVINGEKTVGEELDTFNFNTQYFIETKRRLIVDSESLEFKYAAFCDGCLINGIETFIHREGVGHLASGGGQSRLVLSVLNKETGGLDTVKIFPPIDGSDYRDPSIAYIPETRNIIITTQIYDVIADVYNGGTVYSLNLNYDTISTTQVSENGYFIWGKAIRTPDNKLMVSSYKLDGSEIGIFISAGTPGTPAFFTKFNSIFNDDNSLMRTEVSLQYYKGYLCAFARTQNRSDGSLQDASFTYTADKFGRSGWTSVRRLASSTIVAPRMFINVDGGLVLSAGGIFGGVRGSVSTQVTFDLVTFSVRQTVYRNPSSDGGYASAFLSNGRIVIYTYNETVHLAEANTYLQYFNNDAVAPPVPTPLFDVNQFSGRLYIGGPIVYNSASADSGYISFSVNTPINGVKGIVFGAEPVSTPQLQSLILQNKDGTLLATFSGVTPTERATYFAERESFNIPVGVYRLTLPQARMLLVNNISMRLPSIPYTTISADSMETDVTKYAAFGFVTS